MSITFRVFALGTRGVNQVDLLVTDGHEGLLAAIADLFPTTLRQRCLVHKQRNVMSAIPKREQQEVMADLKGIWSSEKKTETSCLTIVWAVIQDIRLPKIPVG